MVEGKTPLVESVMSAFEALQDGCGITIKLHEHGYARRPNFRVIIGLQVSELPLFLRLKRR